MQFAKQHQEEFSIGLINIDNFKLINEKYPYGTEDAVLREVGNRILSACRDSDFVGRWSDEEFLVIINGSHPAELVNVAERLRKNVCDRMIVYQDVLIPASVTVGLDIFYPANSISAEHIINKLNTALHTEKTCGENKVVCNFE